MSRTLLVLPAVLAFLALSPMESVRAEWIAAGREVPVERLVTNLEARLAKDPDDAAAHAALARILSMAWASGEEAIRVDLPEGKDAAIPVFLPWQTVRVVGSARPLTPARTKLYLASVAHYLKAVELEPDSALWHLGLAWILDDGSAFAAAIGSPNEAFTKVQSSAKRREAIETGLRGLESEMEDVRDLAVRFLRATFPECLPVLMEYREDENERIREGVGRLLVWCWRGFALAEYHLAFDLALSDDMKAESFCAEGDGAISFEAGRAIRRLSEGRILDRAGKVRLAKVKVAVDKLREKPRWITPVVFPLGGEKTLAGLLRTDRTVRFDLDGDGEPGLWPWVGPDTGILVWDPERTGLARSGLDLFGSVTWWMFWENGYAPLAALDDDGDGRLAGEELAGIAVWRDRNGDAVSDPGEVVPVSLAGVVAIRVRPTGRAEGVPAHSAGIEMADGTTRPSFDWTPQRK